MKNRVYLLLMIALALTLCLLLVACGGDPHTHTFAEDFVSDDTNHWHAATCEHTEERSGVAAHEWDEGVVTKEPTEDAEGTRTYTCSTCGKTKTEPVDKLVHQHTYSTTLSYDENGHYYAATCAHTTERKDYAEHTLSSAVTAPTCETDGFTTHSCDCGYSYTDTPVGELGHDWEISASNNDGTHNLVCKNDSAHTKSEACGYDSATVTDPTCETDGYTTHTCDCGHSYTDTPVGQLGHDWEISASNNDGTHNLVCKNDSAHTTSEACDYDSATVTAPTCETDGFTTHTCDCGHSYTDTPVGKLGHDFEITSSNNNGTHNVVCKNDNTHTGSVNCSYKSVVTDPTCEAGGFTTHTCECGHSYKDTFTGKLGHTWQLSTPNGDGSHRLVCERDGNHTTSEACQYTSVVTAPTCTEKGFTTYTCRCGYSYVGDEVAATGHQFKEEWEITDAYHWHAAKCGHTDQTSRYEKHVFDRLVGKTDPTCEAQGYTTYACECGATENRELVDALGHKYGEFSEVGRTLFDDTLCKYAVTYETSCDRCGDPVQKVEYVESHNPYYEDTPSEHCTVTGENAAKKATCQSTGMMHKHCTSPTCKYYSESMENTVLPVNPDGHVWDSGATEGSVTTYTCTLCSTTKTKVTAENGKVDVSSGNVDEVEVGGATINMNTQMKENLTGDGGKVEISAECTDDQAQKDAIIEQSGLADQKELIGDKPIYSFTVNGADRESFGEDGKATITLPYVLGENEDPNNVIILYISDGELIAINATYWEDEDKNGFITFETDHFSYYVAASVSPDQLCDLFGKHSEDVHVVAPTCTTGGYTVCLRCSDIIATTAPLGHKWLTSVAKESSCVENGVIRYSCAECDMAYDVTVAATGHYFVLDEHVVASCNTAGRSTYGCIYCDHAYTVTAPQLAHNYTVKTVAPTCTTHGYTQRSCTLCGDVQTASVAALGHTLGTLWESAEEGHYHVCSVCGGRGEVEAHVPGAEATEENAQLCEICEYVLVPQLTHRHKNMTHFEANAATCTESGNKEYYVCSCGKWFLDAAGTLLVVDHTSVVIDATGHTNEVIDYKAPTCLEAGHTAGVKCAVCDTLLRGNIEIAPTGHTYSQIITKPTCTTGGYTTFKCVGCDDSFEGDQKAALGHRYASEITAPTCETEGFTTYTCTLCATGTDGHTYVGDTVAALGHSFSAVFRTNGEAHWHACTRCDAIDGYEAHVKDHEEATEMHGISCVVCRYEIEAIKNHEHRAARTVPARTASCTVSGTMAYYVCLCGEWFGDEACTNVISDHTAVIVPATGHDLQYQPRVDATCQSAGITAGYFCTVCSFTSGRTEIPVADHNFNTPVSYDGEGHWHKCATCAETDEKQAHVYVTDVTLPTCNMQGYTVFTCSCGYEYVGDYVDALGHSFGDPVSNYDGTHTGVCARDPRHKKTEVCEFTDKVIAPTCTTRGYTIHTCDCGYTYTDSFVKAKGHTYGAPVSGGDGTHTVICANDASHVQTVECIYESVVTAPTCELDGYTTHTCDCGHTYTDAPVGKLGHDFKIASTNNDGTHNLVCERDNAHTETASCSYESVVTAPTCETDGYTTHTCDCGYTYTDAPVGKLGHDFKIVSTNNDGTHNLVCERDNAHTETAGCSYESVVTAPTCETDGYTTHTCDCGHSYTDTPVDKLGHDFKIVSTNNDGTHNLVCERDNAHTETANCSYESVVTAPTCELDGYTTNTCDCGHTYTDAPVGKLGHDFKIVSTNNDGTHNLVCERDNAHTETAGCSYESVVTAPTCKAEGYTTYTCECGHTYVGDPVAKTDHSYVNGACEHCDERETVEEYGLNTILLESAYDASGTLTVRICVKNMDLAGVRFTIDLGGRVLKSAECHENAQYYSADGTLQFVLSSGEEMIAEQTDILTLVLEDEGTTQGLSLDVIEIYSYAADGTLAVPAYTVVYAQ